MHKITLLAALLLLSVFARAQENTSWLINAKIKDGTILIGGNLGGSYQKYSKDNKITKRKENGDLVTAQATLKGGYFFLPDFVAGLNIAVQHTSINVDSTRYGQRTTFFLAGPFVRYYMNNGLFTELSVSAGVNAVKNGDKTDIKTAALGLGYAYFLNPSIAIEPILSFNYAQNRVDNNTHNTKDWQMGPVFNIGIQAYLYSPTRVLPTK